MNTIKLGIKTSFGKIEVSSETTSEILNILEEINPEFLAEVNKYITSILAAQAKDIFEGIIDVGREGPTIITKKKMTHYKAIGLILYSMKDHQSRSR